MKTSKSSLEHVVIRFGEPIAAFGSLDDMLSFIDFCVCEKRYNLGSLLYYNSFKRRRCSMTEFLNDPYTSLKAIKL